MGAVPWLSGVAPAAGAAALGGGPLHFGYADPGRVVDEEDADGTVRHSDLDPDRADDSWQQREREIRDFLAGVLADHPGPWEFRYLAGRADRALTHLARAVDASAIVVGGNRDSSAERVRELLAGSVGLNLARHQHRPVIVVPLSVVDWKAAASW